MKNKIRQIVDSILEKANITEPPVAVHDIALLYGIEVEETAFIFDEDLDDPSEIEGTLEKNNGNWVIRVNSFAPSVRKRFTVAHELGHFFLHQKEWKDSKESFYRNFQWNADEMHANAFAAELLMPLSMIKSKGNVVLSDVNSVEDFIDAMSKVFAVSRQAMTYRLRNLGVIKE